MQQASPSCPKDKGKENRSNQWRTAHGITLGVIGGRCKKLGGAV